MDGYENPLAFLLAIRGLKVHNKGRSKWMNGFSIGGFIFKFKRNTKNEEYEGIVYN